MSSTSLRDRVLNEMVGPGATAVNVSSPPTMVAIKSCECRYSGRRKSALCRPERRLFRDNLVGLFAHKRPTKVGTLNAAS